MTEVKPSLVLTKTNWSEHRDEINQAIDYYMDKEIPVNMASMYAINVSDDHGRLMPRCPHIVSRVDVTYSSEGISLMAELTPLGSVLMIISGSIGCLLHPFVTCVNILANFPPAVKWMRKIAF